MDPLEQAARQELANACRRLHGAGLVAGSGGNVGLRCGSRLLVTPTGRSLGLIVPEELVLMEMDGTVVGAGRPTKEWHIHLMVLLARRDVFAVVHVHPPYSVAVSCLENLDPAMSLPIYTPGYAIRVGLLPLVPFIMPGSGELGRACASALEHRDACLMANHGVTAVGADLEAAINVAEEVEANAQLHLLLDGRGKALPPDLFEKVRRQYGGGKA
ncbi:MAG TPA: class II aldolase/adducin family protein [Symbiobacteriaceae bacterium]|jgi:ribulose-5-phosphate 4-epimerase/fuculose-1-phosphate aldolase